MSFTDKALTCSDCNTGFTFSASEQEFFASKGFTNEPRRCPNCRAARKVQRGGGGYGSGGGGYRQQREMYPAVCASCGKNTQVPFEPRDGRPVYCSDCYSNSRR
ncbi:MAG TPA: zinc-ribbon domain containing protein [Dehalococcoidia bacterium]|nr:zinc-ribbon domain containing protein [Dehalococcoidia bacterium]